jgi:hypothetical protein
MMEPTRRDFIKSLGIGIASLVIARCIPLDNVGNSPRDHLRDTWLKLPWLADQTIEDYEQAQGERSRLLDDHRTYLDKLVSIGEISASAANQLQVAFTEATYHAWRSNAPFTCYLPAPGPDYTPSSSNQLATQAELLGELSNQVSLDLDTVALAQATIERDISFLNLAEEDVQELYNKLIEDAGDTQNYPIFSDLDLEISPDAMEAAEFLIELILKISLVTGETR